MRERNLPDQRVLDVLYIATRFSETLLKDGPNAPELRAINHELERTAQTDPADSYVLTEEAREFVVLRDYARAAAAAKKAADEDAGNWGAREWLTIAAARTHMCHMAPPYIVSAIALQRALLAEKDFMYSSCYADLGALSTARNVLLSLSRHNSAGSPLSGALEPH